MKFYLFIFLIIPAAIFSQDIEKIKKPIQYISISKEIKINLAIKIIELTQLI
jgi:hypothetical protein